MVTENTTTEMQSYTYVECAEDKASRISKQLSSLLASLYGSGFETFSEMNDNLQHNILWLASDLAFQLDKALSEVVCKPKELDHVE